MATGAHAEGAPWRVAFPDRLTRLKGVAGFAALPAAVVDGLATLAGEERYAAGAVVLKEGDAGDRAYLIIEGSAEVTTAGPSGPAALAVLHAGELFGEVALLSAGGTRQATVVALSPLVCLTVDGDRFRHLVAEHPRSAEVFRGAADAMLKARFLKRACPFIQLEPERLAWLAARLQSQRVGTGDVIVRQGEPGEVCFIVRSGRVDVLRAESEGPDVSLTRLGPGDLFGESALLTDAPRNATVRALEATELLVLRRADLVEAMSAARELAAELLTLVHFRARPRRMAGITSTERADPDGETITILKNPERLTYFRLSARGRFLWEHLDGKRTLRDLTLDDLLQFKRFAPYWVAELLAALTAAGFVTTAPLRDDVRDRALELPWWLRAVAAMTKILQWRVVVRTVDRPLTLLYDGGIRFLFTTIGQVTLAAVSIAGLVAFVRVAPRAVAPLQLPSGPIVLMAVASIASCVLIHEAGHAFTTKAAGYEVLGAGVGWDWFTPTFFIDTSDIWRAERGERIAVSLAGPYANIATGSAAALAAWATPDAALTTVLWFSAALSYLLALSALNPVLDYDGYYALADFLDRPNLRSRALDWLVRQLPANLRTGPRLRGHGVDLLYCAIGLAYIVLVATCGAAAYRLLLQPRLAGVLSPSIGAWLAWTPGLILAIFIFASAAVETRRTGPRS